MPRRPPRFLILSGALGACVAGAASDAMLLADGSAVAEESAVRTEDVRAAVAKALPVIEKGAAGHLEHRACFACHSQALPVLALRSVRDRGFAIDAAGFDKHLDRTHAVLSQWAERNPDRKNFTGGAADTAGYALLALELGDRKPDDTTAAVVEYLLQRDESRGHWRASHDDRPPTEASSFTTTAWAVRAIRAFGTPEQRERVADRTRAAREWLLRAGPRDTEDRVFRLWGLKYSEAEAQPIAAAVKDLLDTQRGDGGWAQTAEMESDAYATGSALVALHQAGGLATGDPAYQRGVRFLLADQREDGTWFVQSRSANRFQTYFETGFPYKQDQWISIAASAWATAALALELAP
ncbi:MAG: prenyltransferase/squalene oxidase repeat-containing protein [Planctomycetales bacterium]